MKAKPLTIHTTRAWMARCSCPPDKCKTKDARQCQNWNLRKEIDKKKQK